VKLRMFTRTELEELRASVAASPAMLADRPDVMETLLAQAEYALDCAALLDEAVHFPAEPYSDAEALVARLTDGVNEIWNRRK
jgi:hypothetical protein